MGRRGLGAQLARDPRQLSLDEFYLPAPPALTPGSLDLASELRGVLSDALNAARVERGIGRDNVAARMSELTGHPISVPMLNSWTAESHRRHRFPLEWAPAFEVAAETHALQQLFAGARGTVVVAAEQLDDLRMARLERQKAQIEDEMRRLRRGLYRRQVA